jgi:hypothetical protein
MAQKKQMGFGAQIMMEQEISKTCRNVVYEFKAILKNIGALR